MSFMTSEVYAGLMSGTSLDGVDGVLVDFSKAGLGIEVLAHVHRSFPADLRQELLALNRPSGNEIERAALAANALAGVYADVVAAALHEASLDASQVKAVGAHGQTIRHRPGEFDGIGFTCQLNNPALLAERCGIDVVADFRSRDLAAGGQAAPLVPVFHRALFAQPGQTVSVLNIGGISNLTVLEGDQVRHGFDCGPGNALMDLWIERNLQQPYDASGAWAAGGAVDPQLLQTFVSDAYFSAPPPKSTGRDLFHAEWLDAHLRIHGSATQDVQATLCELTAQSCADAVLQYAPGSRHLFVCGGGALNDHLMRRLAARLPALKVASTEEAGLPPLQVEAVAFAWLARAFIRREPGNIVAVTGARGPRILGALYPA